MILALMYRGVFLDFAETLDDVLSFLFDVVAIAVSNHDEIPIGFRSDVVQQSELLLDRLMLICSAVILKFININNVCSVLTDAAHYHADVLVEKLEHYMSCNLETLLVSRMLDELQFSLVKRLSAFVRTLQDRKQPFARSNTLVEKAMEKHADWLALQDIPTAIVRSDVKKGSLAQTKMSPPSPGGAGKRSRRRSGGVALPSPLTSPLLAPVTQARLPIVPAGDDIFEMDVGEPDSHPVQPSAHSDAAASSAPASGAIGPWKSSASGSANRCVVTYYML